MRRFRSRRHQVSSLPFVRGAGWFGLCIIVLALFPSMIQAETVSSVSEHSADSSQEGESIVLEAKTSTWMPRGRNLQDAAPLVRGKLSAAGFLIKTEQGDPPILSLQVDYQETRGLQYTLDSFGTKITCAVELIHPTRGTLWKILVHESSGHHTYGTPPYIVALQKFQTNPYIYFLGDIIKGRALEGLDISQSLIQGFRRLMKAKKAAVDPLLNPHSMEEAESSYALQAQAKALTELGLIKDPSAVSFLREVLNHSDQNLRILSVKALGAIGSSTARTALQQASTGHADQRVRQEAAAVLNEFFPLSTS